MKARVQWAGEALFLGESGSGHAVVMDGPPDAGGRNLGIRPMEMLLIGLGGCSNFDVVSILRKGRQPVESCEVFLDAERADEEPKVFTKIHLHFVVKGRGLKPLYAHCLGGGPKPRITVTSHPAADGQWVWYLGGDIAVAIVTKLTGQAPSASEASAAVDQALSRG